MERANGIILNGISKKLVGLPTGKWVDELTNVVWSHNTSVSRAMGFNSFKLLYAEETMTPKGNRHRSLSVINPKPKRDG